MSLNLDKRQRAMLREMGVRVWQPAAPPAGLSNAIEIIAVGADAENATSGFTQKIQPAKASVGPLITRKAPPPARNQPRPAGPEVAPPSQPRTSEAQGSGQASWRMGETQPLYEESAQAGGPCWLVLAETPAAALQLPVFAGDAGKLLDNMLRAARLNRSGAVLFAPLVRHAASGETQAFSAALAGLLERARPDIVLVMGRMAAQAVLQSTEPFGKLRGRCHALHNVKTIATYDANYLLRAPADKAKAWDDLCLAMSLASKA